MSQIADLYTQSSLAFAAYADATTSLEDALKIAGMTESQAADFASKWTVVDQYSGALGLSATVFQEISSGKRYLAIRGTESLGDLGNNYILANGFPSELNPQFSSLRDQINLWTTNGALPTSFTVAGHSLGGYLANAVAMQFGSRVSGVYTYNTPGVDGLLSPIVDALRGALGVSGLGTLSNVTNVRGTAGVSLISGLGNQIAPPLLIETESSLNPITNHNIVGLTDSLAVYDLYATLAPNLDAAGIKTLIQSASNTMPASLEKMLDQLRAVFLGESALTTGKTAVDDRDEFHINLKALADSDTFRSLAGKVTIYPVGGNLAIQARARVDFQTLAALQVLSPLVINAAGSEDQAALDALWQSAPWSQTYQDWLADKASIQAGGKAENFTDNWLTDRAILLTAITARNTKDGDGLAYSSALPTDRAYDLHWTDASGAEKILIAENTARQGGVLAPVPMQRFWFDGGGNTTITGTDNKLSDHLYGGAGNDDINANAGNDYLEGNTGNDSLKGGEGQDTLLGGTGDDQLDGGTGSDILKGGQGTDTYTLRASDSGMDTIVDSDGLGQIKVVASGGGETVLGLTAIEKIANGSSAETGTWQSEDKRFTYTTRAEADGSQTLSISGGGVSTVVKSFTSGDLGINLPDAQPSQPTPTTGQQILGDLGAINFFLQRSMCYEKCSLIRPLVWDFGRISLEFPLHAANEEIFPCAA